MPIPAELIAGLAGALLKQFNTDPKFSSFLGSILPKDDLTTALGFLNDKLNLFKNINLTNPDGIAAATAAVIDAISSLQSSAVLPEQNGFLGQGSWADIQRKTRSGCADATPTGAAPSPVAAGNKTVRVFFRKVPTVLGGDKKPLGDDEVKDLFQVACREWRKKCGISFIFADSEISAHIIVDFGPVDGPAGPDLALTDVGPPTGGSALIMTFKDTETFTGDPTYGDFDFVTVAAHEMGHAMGLVHEDASVGDLMFGMYQQTVSEPQPNDIQVAQNKLGWGPPVA